VAGSEAAADAAATGIEGQPPVNGDSVELEATDDWGNFISDLVDDPADPAQTEAAGSEAGEVEQAPEAGPKVEDFLLEPTEPVAQWPADPADAVPPQGWVAAEVHDATTFHGVTAEVVEPPPPPPAADPIFSALAAAAAKRRARSVARSAQAAAPAAPAAAAPAEGSIESCLAEVRNALADLTRRSTNQQVDLQPLVSALSANTRQVAQFAALDASIQTLVDRVGCLERVFDEHAGVGSLEDDDDPTPVANDSKFRTLLGVALLLLCWGALFWVMDSARLGLFTIVAANAVGCAALVSRRPRQ
jgi:hypothetical protein